MAKEAGSMSKAEKAILLDAVNILLCSRTMTDDDATELRGKINNGKFTAEDTSNMQAWILVRLRDNYNWMATNERAWRGVRGKEHYELVSKKLEIEVLNKALNMIKDIDSRLKGSNIPLRVTGIVPAVPFAVAGENGLSWVSIVLGAVNLALFLYAIYAVRKIKKGEKIKEVEME